MKFIHAIALSILILAIGLLSYLNLPLFQKENENTKNEEVVQNLVAQNAPQQKVLAACDGVAGSEKTPDGNYKATAFGCYKKDDGSIFKDPEDNCIGWCGTDSLPECAGLSGPECQAKLVWFAANKDRFGCFNKLKVTNPATGKSVVVQVIDQGPACSRENTYGPLIDLSYPAAFYLGGDGTANNAGGNYETLHVEEVPKDTPLGIADGSTPVSSGTTGTGTTTGGSGSIGPLQLVLRAKENNTYVKNEATAEAIGGTGGSGSNPGGGTGSTPGNNGPVNPDATCPGSGEVTCNPYPDCHCSDSYQQALIAKGQCPASGCPWCASGGDSAKWATDISNPVLAPVYIPKISVNGEAHTVTCKGYSNESYGNPLQIAQILSCVDDITKEVVWMQFHHSDKNFPITEGAAYKSGDAIGKSEEYAGVGSHVHFQIGIGGPCGSDTSGCRNSNEYIKCG